MGWGWKDRRRMECFLLINIVKSRKTAYMRDSLYKNNWLINLNHMNMFALARSVARKDSNQNRTFMQVWFCSYFLWTRVEFLRTVKVFGRTQSQKSLKFHNGDFCLTFSNCLGTGREKLHSDFYPRILVAFVPQKQSHGHKFLVLWHCLCSHQVPLNSSSSVCIRGSARDRQMLHPGDYYPLGRDVGTGALKPGKQSCKIITKGSTSSRSRW